MPNLETQEKRQININLAKHIGLLQDNVLLVVNEFLDRFQKEKTELEEEKEDLKHRIKNLKEELEERSSRYEHLSAQNVAYSNFEIKILKKQFPVVASEEYSEDIVSPDTNFDFLKLGLTQYKNSKFLTMKVLCYNGIDIMHNTFLLMKAGVKVYNSNTGELLINPEVLNGKKED